MSLYEASVVNLWCGAVWCGVTEELILLYARPKFGAENGSKLARATGAKGDGMQITE